MGKVRNLLTLTKSKKKPVQPIQDNSQNGKKRKLKTSGHKVEECEDPIEDYLVTMRETMREQTFSIRRSYEMRIRWVLRDAMARIGRSEWSSRRTGSGKLCAARIQVGSTTTTHREQVLKISCKTMMSVTMTGKIAIPSRRHYSRCKLVSFQQLSADSFKSIRWTASTRATTAIFSKMITTMTTFCKTRRTSTS